MSRFFTAFDLMTAEYPEPVWAVPNLIPEGLTVIAGKPKIGKSWLLMSLAVAISEGGRAFGSIEVDAGPVLMISLEDSPRRLQSRLGKVLHGAAIPKQLHIADRWPRLDNSGFELLASAIDYERPRAVFIDTYGRIKRQGTGRNMYDEDSDAASELQELAQDTGTAIVVSHHLNQSNQEDWTERFSGSSGLIGVADTLAGIFRDRGEADAVLRLIGRDIEERDLALRFDTETALWSILGDWQTYQLSEARRAVLEVVESGDGVGTIDIAEEIGRDKGQVSRMLKALAEEGFVQQKSTRGPWYPSHPRSTRSTESTQPPFVDPVDSIDKGWER